MYRNEGPRLVEPPPAAGPARQGALVVTAVTAHTAHLRGPGIVDVLDRLEIPRQWSAEGHCWGMPARRVQDLAADCQRHGRRLVVQDALRW